MRAKNAHSQLALVSRPSGLPRIWEHLQNLLRSRNSRTIAGTEASESSALRPRAELRDPNFAAAVERIVEGL